MKNLAWFVWLLPRNAGVVLIRAYRAVVSPLYGDVCRYYPSCSAYGLGAVQHRGLVIGSALTGWRILRCNPWSAGGVDDVPLPRVRRFHVTRFGFVIPADWAGAGSGSRRPEQRSGRRRVGVPIAAADAHPTHVHSAHDHAQNHDHSPAGEHTASVSRRVPEPDLSPITSRKD
ncbi:membrane protein insertion efficiency factor YidD [Agromyces sp. GXS1127]|uniref:membrane protein insertion efficiency factor YidD n=1 Tax=Agromyces sp. GXS1127 TaxID=3424181 RepID=UPI003D315928